MAIVHPCCDDDVGDACHRHPGAVLNNKITPSSRWSRVASGLSFLLGSHRLGADAAPDLGGLICF